MHTSSKPWETGVHLSPRKGAHSKYPSWKGHTPLKPRKNKYVHFLHLNDSELARLFTEHMSPLVEAENCFLHLLALPAGITRSQIIHRLETQHCLYLLLDHNEEAMLQASLLIKSIPSELLKGIRVVLLLKKKEKAPEDKRPLEQTLGVSIRHIIRPLSSSLNLPKGSQLLKSRQIGQYRRIAREIAGTRLGLVLSSGGAKGFSYVGVLQVLEEMGLEFDAIAGSSIGAIMGALWAKGYDSNQLTYHVGKFREWMHLRRLFDHMVDIRRGLLRGDRMENFLRELLGDSNFTDLSVPLIVTATDIGNLCSSLIQDGDVASALHASVAIPGICIPCNREHHTFIDGGVSNPLPVHSLKEMGIENVLAVSTVFREVHGYEMSQHREYAEMNRRENRPLRHRINSKLNLFAHGNAFDILMRSIETAHGRMVEPEIAMADLVLEPHPPDSRWQEFLQPDKYLKAGRQVANEHLDDLQALEENRTTKGHHL